MFVTQVSGEYSLKTDLSAIATALREKPFRAHPLFRGGHAQTLLGYLYPRRSKLGLRLRPHEERLFEVAPGVRLLAHCNWQAGDRRASPSVLLVHGLEGSSDSVYMLGTAAKAFENGFNVIRLNLRTCGGSEHLSESLYHSGMSGDLCAVIEELINRDKLEEIFLGGFSLGGNMSLKLAGESGANAPRELRGICAISPAIDLAAAADTISQSSNWLYNQRFLKALAGRMRRVQKLYPGSFAVDGIKKLRSIRDFDSRFTAVYGGFKDVDDYYTRSSSLPLIKNIRVPTLIVHAADDPFVPFEAFLDPSLSANPFVILLTPPHGGHVGFIADNSLHGENRFWAENRLVEFFRRLADDK